MSSRLADARRSDLASDDVQLLAAITGLSSRTVAKRVEKAHGNTTMLSVFADEWPQDAEALSGITVAAAKRANLEDEIGLATGLSVRSIRSALKDVHGKTLLGNAIPELEDDEGDEEDEEERAPGGQERFLDDETAFPVLELLGAVRVVSVRRARPLVTWLAPRVGLTVGALVSRFRNANGRALLSTVLEDKWPVRVAGPSRTMLAKLTVGAIVDSAPLVRWVADSADLDTADVLERLEGASPNTRMAKVLPELVGEEAPPAPKAKRQGQRRPARSEPPESGPPPSERRRIVGGKYELQSFIGSGGFGKTWEALRLEHPKKRVVVKTAPDATLGRLSEEAQVAFDLRHQNICNYQDYGHDPTFGTYLVMDHCGVSLESLIDGADPITLSQAIDVVQQVAAGLDYAHRRPRPVIHQDVKPANILVEQHRPDEWEVRLGDFGIALQGRGTKNTEGKHTVIATSPIAYTRPYAAPEQIRGEKARKASDQYSLALVFCSMLEGRVFQKRYQRRDFARLSSRQNGALARALRDRPDDRFESCTAFAKALAGGK